MISTAPPPRSASFYEPARRIAAATAARSLLNSTSKAWQAATILGLSENADRGSPSLFAAGAAAKARKRGDRHDAARPPIAPYPILSRLVRALTEIMAYSV
jgi:hypothetical protein